MLGFAICWTKARIKIIEGRRRVLAFLEDAATVDVMKDDIKVLRLIGEATVVVKDILALDAARLGGNLNRLSSGQSSEHRWRQALRWRASPA
jgi:hypothetical protein